MPFLLYLLKTYWWHVLRPQTSKRSQVSQQRKCKVWQLYLTLSCSFHRPRGARVSEKHNHKTENNGLKRTKMTALRQASSLTQTSPLASLSVLWGNVSLPPDQTTAGGSLASLTCPYKASQWTCPSVRTDPRQPLSRKRRECAGRWGGGGLHCWFVCYFFVCIPCTWGARLLGFVCVWNWLRMCVHACVCVFGGGGLKRMWRRTQRLTHHPLRHPIINRSLLPAQYLLNTQTFRQLYQTKPSLLTQITSRCSSKPSL